MKYKKSTKKFDVWNPTPKACLYFIVIAFTLVIRLFILWFMRFLFLTLQVSDNNLFYLEAIHNFVEVSHDDESNFWPWRIKYFQNLPITSKHMHNSYELSDVLEHKHVRWSNPPFLPIPDTSALLPPWICLDIIF